jgi:C4-dicarboxylate transporter DctM subunit
VSTVNGRALEAELIPTFAEERVPPPRARLVRAVDAASAAYDRVAMLVASVLLAAMVVTVALEVAMRYLFNHPLTFTEELSTYMFGWVIFLGATVTVRRNTAPSLQVLVDHLPARLADVVRDLALVLSLVTAVVLLVWGGLASQSTWEQSTPALQWPLGLPLLVVPIAGAGFSLHFLAALLRRAERGRQQAAQLSAAVVVAGVVLWLPIYFLPNDTATVGLLIAIVAGFLIGMPVGFVLTFGVLLALLTQQSPLHILSETMFTGASNFILMAVPFFMLTGAIMQVGGLAQRLIDLASALVGRFRGGLLLVDVVSSAFFADISGSAVADTVAIGSVMLPGMIKRGYDRKFATALQAASGTLGVLFPPSIATIIYAWVAGVSVADMFLASFLPAFLMVFSFCAVAYYVAVRRDYPREPSLSARQVMLSFWRSLFALMTPVLILFGILRGVVTPTEAGVVAVLYTAVVSMGAYRTMSLGTLFESLELAVMGTARVMFILSAAILLGWMLTILEVPQGLSSGMLGLSRNPLVLLLLLNLILVLVHGVLETSATLILIVPLVIPVFTQVGVDPVHLGIIFLVNSALGLLTPPMGLLLYVAAPITGLKVEVLAKAVIPFLVTILVDLVLIVLFPQISTVIPYLVHHGL